MSDAKRPSRPSAIGLVITLGIIVVGLVAIGGLVVAQVLGDEEPAPPEPMSLAVVLEPVAGDLQEPVVLVGAGDGTGDRYVAEKVGRVTRMLPDGTFDPVPLVDISDRVLDHHERGLLGLAFHPSFADNGRFYLAYTFTRGGSTVISEFTVPGEPEPPEEGEEPQAPIPVEQSEKYLLVLPQPFSTHKGGMLGFDEDGMLLISTGDGGSGSDPFDNAQDPSSLLGKILRIDVDNGYPYGIPEDNGFAGVPGAHPEIHAIGLRNPWRFSLDPATGDLYIADVGQGHWEEVNVLRAGEREVSFGWNRLEGEVCYRDGPCVPEDHTPPAVVYPHVYDDDQGHCAIIGGHAYRGSAGSLPDGTYLYADYCSGTVWAVPAEQLAAGTTTPTVVAQHDPTTGQILGFGRDDAGEIYVLTSSGDVLHVTAA